MLRQSRLFASAITLVLFAALLFGLGVAWADLTATASLDSTTGDYTVSFKDTGLGNTPITYELTAGTATSLSDALPSKILRRVARIPIRTRISLHR